MEEKEFYCDITAIVLIYISLGIFFIPVILALVYKNIYATIFFLICFLIIYIRLFVMTEEMKDIFHKIRVNSTGICRFYKNKIIHEIKWENLIEVRCYNEYNLIFLDYIANDAEIEKYTKTNIVVALTPKNIKGLALFKEHFKHKITDIKSLGKYEKDRLL